MVIRPACAAGEWYPADADELITSIAELLLSFPVADYMPHALVVPHSKLESGGPVSAAAFRHLSKLSSVIENVIVIAATEDDAKGAILPICEHFSTPLGPISLDRRKMQSLSLLPFVSRSDRSHYYSSRIEVQLPFLQTCLTDFTLLPVLIGELARSDLSLLFDSLPSGRETLIVLSMDVVSKRGSCVDPAEQVVFTSFVEHCQQAKWKIKTANTDKDAKLRDVLESFIIH